MGILNMTSNNYYTMKTLLEACGYKIITKYRKNLKVVKMKNLKRDKNDK
jgi:hypothetical protein